MEKNGPREITTAMKRLVPLLIFLALSLPALGAEWRLDLAESSLTFSATQLGLPFEGEFKNFTALICFEETDLDATNVHLDIDTTSAATGIAERDEILTAEEWLNTAAFPDARVDIQTIQRVGPNSYSAAGQLTIKGNTQPFTLPFILDLVENTASGELTIDRRDFGIGEGEWGMSEKWVGYQIVIKFHITALNTERDCEQ